MPSCSGEVSCLSRWPEPERSPVTLPVVDLDLIASGGSSELFELVDRAFEGVAFLVSFGVERGWASASGAAFAAVGRQVGAFGDGGGDSALAEVGADPFEEIRFAARDRARSGPGPATTMGNAGPRHDRRVADT